MAAFRALILVFALAGCAQGYTPNQTGSDQSPWQPWPGMGRFYDGGPQSAGRITRDIPGME